MASSGVLSLTVIFSLLLLFRLVPALRQGGNYRRTGTIRPRQARSSLIIAKASSYPSLTERVEGEEVMRTYEASQRDTSIREKESR